MKFEYSPKPDADAVNYTGSMDTQDVYDCISAMIAKEPLYICQDYIEWAKTETLYSKIALAQHKIIDVVDEDWRLKMCEWMFHVTDSTELQRETASVAMSFLDRFLCSNSKRAAKARTDIKEYQLAAMTCFYIAVKIREPFEMDACFLSQISNGVHSAQEITSLELDILKALHWKLNGPTSFQFVNYLLELVPESARSAVSIISAISHLQADRAVKYYAFVALHQSTIAIASILNSLEFVTADNFPLQERIKYFQAVANAFDLDICSQVVQTARAHLHDIFAEEAGYGMQVPCSNNGNAAAA